MFWHSWSSLKSPGKKNAKMNVQNGYSLKLNNPGCRAQGLAFENSYKNSFYIFYFVSKFMSEFFK